MIKSAIADVVAGRDLSEEQARAVMTAIMEEEVTPAQFAALVTALRIKGETVDEVAGFAGVMRDKAVPVQADGVGVVVDTCGTGGAGRGHYPGPAGGRILPGARRHRLHAGAAVSPGDALRRGPAPRDRHSHRLQHPGSVDQSGPCQGAGARGRR